MAYRHYANRRAYSRPTPRHIIVVKYDGKCACCGAPIRAGESATYYPPGTIASVTEGRIAHIGGIDGTSPVCTANIRKGYEECEQRAVNAYAGDGLDSRWEDSCAEMCGCATLAQTTSGR